MAAELKVGEKIVLAPKVMEKRICLGVNWGAARTYVFLRFLRVNREAVDLDLSCALYNGQGQMVDHLYSPLFRPDLLKAHGPPQGSSAPAMVPAGIAETIGPVTSGGMMGWTTNRSC